jgi:hypothetical protein
VAKNSWLAKLRRFILGWLLSLTIWVFNIREDFKEFKSDVNIKLELIWKEFKKRKKL